MRYSNIGKEKANGVVYTPKAMADYLAKEMVNHKSCDNYNCNVIRILDPAVGRGELLCALLNTISSHCVQIEVIGYETDAMVCKKTQEELLNLFPNVNISIRNEDFLKAVEEQSIGLFDYVIANPPYIRT